ncbi:hypothetical protein BJ508DRAFT_199850, partial [Ascobolus immersus RN42]
EAGLTQQQVSDKLNVPRRTVGHWAQSRRTRRPGASRSGRPLKLDKHDIRRLIARIHSSWEGRKLSWRKLARDCGLDVCGQTIKNHLEAVGYHRCKACKKPFISKKAQEDRVLYAEEHGDKPKEYWRVHMYADECHFNTAERGTVYVTRKSHERYHPQC